MKLVYICSPYRGNTESNTAKARRYCRFACSQGVVPIAPHLLYPQFLDDDIPEERETGMLLGMELLKHSHELWVFGDRISEGMKAEIEASEKNGIKNRYFKERSGEIHEDMA